MSEIKVSVIVPVYNADKYLATSLGQICNQTLRDIEIICVNDGSTDRSLSILNRFAAEDKRITVITQENTNAGAARNKGMELAKGEYLSFLDADDMFEPEMLERAYSIAKKERADIVAYRSDRFDEGTGAYEDASWTINEKMLPTKDVFSCKDSCDFFRCFIGWAWDKLIIRTLVVDNKITFQSQRTFNDLFFVNASLASANRVVICQDVLVHKRVGIPRAITTRYLEKSKSEDLYYALDSFHDFLTQRDNYSLTKESYIKYAAYYVLWNLDKFLNSDQEAYRNVYKNAQKWISKLGLLKDDAMPLLDAQTRDLIDYVCKMSADEYKWKRGLEAKDGSYLFPFEMIPKGSKVILYGAGKVGRTYYRQIKYSSWGKAVTWVDSHPENKGSIVQSIEDVAIKDFDYIVIAVRDKAVADFIRADLVKRGAEKDKICWREPDVELKG